MLPVEMWAYNVAPYPNISWVFERGNDGAPSVTLDAIAVVEPNVTENEDGTFNYEVAPNIPVSYSNSYFCTSSRIVLYHPMKYLQSCLNTLCMTLFHVFLIHEEANSQE
jgi:hypothetical protein